MPVEIYGENNENARLYTENINVLKEMWVEDANAVTMVEERTIYLSSDSYDSLTLMHEFFHLLDFYGKGDNTAISNEVSF